MACSKCCATGTGNCCNGGTCSTKSKIACLNSWGTFTAGGTCATKACTQSSGSGDCTTTDPCTCASSGGTTQAGTSCNCNTLSAAGVANGGCAWKNCKECNATTGACESTCTAPRQCCVGTCCPESQYCKTYPDGDKTCWPRCENSEYCPNNTGLYDCCQYYYQKCCGSAGCKSTMVTTNATVNSQTNSFQGTGVTLTANQAVTITAYGNIYYDTDNNLQAGPDGVFPNIYPGTSPIPSAGHASLIGQVGNVKFAVGSSYSGAPGSGSLTLRVNDTVVADNQGSFYVQIIRETDPCPNYNPAAIGDPIVYKAGQPLTGPGAEVKAILAKFGIVASATCSCNARAAQMDAWGMGGCLKRIPEITGWLREEAEKRGLWFCAPAGVALILLAISLAALKRLWQGNNK